MCCYELLFPSRLFLSLHVCAHEANYCPTAPMLIITECTADPAFVLQWAAHRLHHTHTHTHNGDCVLIQHHGQLSKMKLPQELKYYIKKIHHYCTVGISSKLFCLKLQCGWENSEEVSVPSVY